jgi:hypothetical protein
MQFSTYRKLKVEQLILFQNTIFQKIYPIILDRQKNLEENINYLNNTYIIFDKIMLLCSEIKFFEKVQVKNINIYFEESFTNIELKKIKIFFKMKITELTLHKHSTKEEYQNPLKKWIEDLDKKLNEKFIQIQNQLHRFLSSEDNTKELHGNEERFQEHLVQIVKNFDSLNSQFEEVETFNKINKEHKHFYRVNDENNLLLTDLYENKLIQENLEDLNIVYEKHLKDCSSLFSSIVEKIKPENKIFNYQN